MLNTRTALGAEEAERVIRRFGLRFREPAIMLHRGKKTVLEQ